MSDFDKMGDHPYPMHVMGRTPSDQPNEGGRPTSMSPVLAAPYGQIPRQTRSRFDPHVVIQGLIDGKEPAQGWLSLTNEAMCRIIELETAIKRIKDEAVGIKSICDQTMQD